MPSSDNSQDQVSLLIDGRIHSQWTTYQIESDLLTPADAWRVGLGLADSVFPAAVAPGARVNVRVGRDPVLSGRIDTVSRRSGRSPRLSMSGRDDAAILVDCSAPIFVAREIGLDDLVAKVIRPLGISKIRIDADTAGGTAEKVAVEPGATAWDMLEEVAEANGLWPWFEPDGTLVVGGPDYTSAPVATLIERFDGQGNNVMDLDHSSSINDRYSEVTVLGQAHGTGGQDGQNALRAVARDASLSVYRPLIVTDGDIQDQAQARTRARKALTDGRLSGETLTATVRGHRNSAGVLWTPGQRIQVRSEPLGIDAVWFMMSRTFSGGRGAQTLTSMVLKEDGVWTLDARKPTRRTRGRKKLEAVIVDVTGN